MNLRKLPIGIQDFPRIREEGYLYVDKTRFVHKLATEGSVYFLSRPRRFGKSLLLSTLGAYFEAKRELFQGLAIEQLEQDWIEYPVLRLDLNAKEFGAGRDYLLRHMEHQLSCAAAKVGVALRGTDPDERFANLISDAHAAKGRRVVVLVDDCDAGMLEQHSPDKASPEGDPQDVGREYDKPLLSTIGKPELHESMKDVLKAFYGVLKSVDAHLKFVLLTGVTKFGQVSVFSDLNQLMDLSMHPDFAAVCGLTEEELTESFAPELADLADRQNLSEDACIAEVRRMYNGYRFHPKGPGVYNPFSTLNLLNAKEFRDYWFQTGTPTFLMELLKSTDTDLREIDGVEMEARDFANYRADADRPLPVIYQSGYLTIKSYDPSIASYTLGYPNAEVKNGFLQFLLPHYSGIEQGRGGFHVGKFSQELRAGDVEAFLVRLRSFFAGIPYELNDQTERHYQVVFYLVFKLLGQYVEAEVRSAKGRADAVVKTEDSIFVFEFTLGARDGGEYAAPQVLPEGAEGGMPQAKLKGTAASALKQIDEQGYLLPYETDGRKLVKVGVQFDKKKRNLGKWLIG